MGRAQGWGEGSKWGSGWGWGSEWGRSQGARGEDVGVMMSSPYEGVAGLVTLTQWRQLVDHHAHLGIGVARGRPSRPPSGG